MFPDFGPIFKALFWSAVCAWPLALWKLVDIGIWLVNHVSVRLQ